MPVPTILSYALQDDQGVKNNTKIFVSYDGLTLNVDGLTGAWAAYGALIDPCIDGQIIGGSVTIPLLPAAGWKTTPANGNNVNQLMVLDFENDFDTFLEPIDLPSYKEALLTAAHIPDLADPALAALIAAIIAGSGAVFPNSDSSRDLNALRKVFLTTRKVRGNRQKTTVIVP